MEGQLLDPFVIVEGDLCLAGPTMGLAEGEILTCQSLAERDGVAELDQILFELIEQVESELRGVS